MEGRPDFFASGSLIFRSFSHRNPEFTVFFLLNLNCLSSLFPFIRTLYRFHSFFEGHEPPLFFDLLLVNSPPLFWYISDYLVKFNPSLQHFFFLTSPNHIFCGTVLYSFNKWKKKCSSVFRVNLKNIIWIS